MASPSSTSTNANINIDLEDTFMAVVGQAIWDQEPEFTISKLEQLKKTCTLTIPKIRSQKPERLATITTQDWDSMKTLLATFCKLVDITEKLCKDLNVKGILTMFVETEQLDLQWRQASQALYDLFEAANWGKPTLAIYQTTHSSSSQATSLSGPNRNRAATSSSANTSTLVYKQAPNDHPIFGLNGIMHHIARRKTSVTTSYAFFDGYVRKDFRVFGDNGIAVGTCWPLQIAALRDGAHGARIGGISGSDGGAYSIIVSGTYDDTDKDLGDKILYSSAGSGTTTAAAADLSKTSTKALIRSIGTRNPIRVIRSSSGRGVFAPRAGLRYDGLYTVESYEALQNNKGGMFVRFRLDRVLGQLAVNTAVPSSAQIGDFARVSEGY